MANIVQAHSTIPALKMDESELISVLQNSIYPGAKLESIKMVIGVCKASGKDPLKKPYHVVPMQVSSGKKDQQGWDIKEWRDVIMPGINDYRTDAARTGQHAGTSEPEFGPDVSETLDGVQITYPKWCRVTVKRQLPSGQIVEFSAVELWKENYATKSGKSDAPNAMWRRRPYAQLAKCAEAQALRKGFPEVGSQPTADEMEGKALDDYAGTTIDADTGEIHKPGGVKMPQSKSRAVEHKPAQTVPHTVPEQPEVLDAEPPRSAPPRQASASGAGVSVGQINFLKKKIEAAGLDEAAVCAQHDIASLDGIDQGTWEAIKADLTGVGA